MSKEKTIQDLMIKNKTLLNFSIRPNKEKPVIIVTVDTGNNSIFVDTFNRFTFNDFEKYIKELQNIANILKTKIK